VNVSEEPLQDKPRPALENEPPQVRASSRTRRPRPNSPSEGAGNGQPAQTATTVSSTSAPPWKRCPSCNAEMGSDGVLCVNCGWRRKSADSDEAEAATTTPAVRGWVTRFAKGVLVAVGLLVVLGIVGTLLDEQSGTTPDRAASVSTKTEPKRMSDDQLFDYVSTRIQNLESPQEKIDLLESYRAQYPKGKHLGQVLALLEREEDEAQTIRIEFYHGGRGRERRPVRTYGYIVRVDKHIASHVAGIAERYKTLQECELIVLKSLVDGPASAEDEVALQKIRADISKRNWELARYLKANGQLVAEVPDCRSFRGKLDVENGVMLLLVARSEIEGYYWLHYFKKGGSPTVIELDDSTPPVDLARRWW